MSDDKKPDLPDKRSYSAEEYTPAVKRRKMEPELVELPQCENCFDHAVVHGICMRCGHLAAIRTG